jgi:sterol desaturase/sphingolipid hydroxylase (fatty acid hydroxylase superfamily)
MILTVTEHLQKDKGYITDRTINNDVNNILSSVLIETSTHILLKHYYIFVNRQVVYDLLLFVPISFVFELIYDFLHYWIHRLFHSNAFLYKYIHKKHHNKSMPTLYDTYHQSLFDVILSNSIPFVVSVVCVRYISYYQFVLITVYKTAVEVAGHSGKKIYPTSSFPQCPFVVKWFEIELYTEDHDSHHRLINCNYSKRLSLWDKVFGSYKKIDM